MPMKICETIICKDWSAIGNLQSEIWQSLEVHLMKKAILMFLILSIAISTVGRASTSASGEVAFINVNVIPMDKERVLPRQTVIVRNGTIVEIGDAKRIKVPANAQRIDGVGKFLIPGLADMHVHLFSDDEFPDALAEDEFKIMIAHGVTTIRLMTGYARTAGAATKK